MIPNSTNYLVSNLIMSLNIDNLFHRDGGSVYVAAIPKPVIGFLAFFVIVNHRAIMCMINNATMRTTIDVCTFSRTVIYMSRWPTTAKNLTHTFV